MNKPIIVIDLDNTLAASAKGFVDFSNKHFGTSITIDDYDEDREKTWGVSFEEAERRMKVMRDSKSQNDYVAFEQAREVLIQLKKDYTLIILTSRRKESEADTMNWLNRYYPGIFDEVLLSGFFEAETVRTGHLLTKGEQYEQIGAAYVIDDYYKHCESAAEVNARAILFGNYPWNQIEELPPNTTRCTNWLEVGEYFNVEVSALS